MFCVAAGLVYAAVQLRVLGSVSETWNERSAFIASVETGQKPLETRQAVSLLRFALDVEARRTSAIAASRDLLVVLAIVAIVAIVACCVLGVGIRGVPREHWPRLSFERERAG
jgi:hypothetical protein